MAASNYQDVLGQLVAAGLVVTELQLGRLERCRVAGDRERRGWYSLHEVVSRAGDTLIVGSYGIWQGASSNTQRIEIRKDAFAPEQREALRRRIADDKRRADAIRAGQAKRAAERARKAWAKCSTQGESEYLARKCVAGHGVRYSPSGALVIPLLDTVGSIHGLQIIRSRRLAEAEQRPEKEYWPSGVAKKGHFHLIGAPATLVLVAEGYATGASLHEATGFPVAIAWDAGNLGPVTVALRKRYEHARILICADDDTLVKCKVCKARLVLTDQQAQCPSCGGDHGATNAGVASASAAAVESRNAAFVRPRFADDDARVSRYLERGVKLTDFNDLHVEEGLHAVRSQVEARLSELGWTGRADARQSTPRGPGGKLRPIESIDELLERFALIYGGGGVVFDRAEHCVLQLSDMRDACRTRELHREWMEHPDREIVHLQEVDFDPSCTDRAVTCNLWAGWPTEARAGSCEHLLELLRHMCSEDAKPEQLYQWVTRWLAYPIQHPGAKMKTTLVLHGPQGTGKNMFFEAVMSMYGPYGRVIDQSAIEDKFNDWASRKLFLVADEVVARADAYQVKNKLKAFITGEWVRINPKNVAARDERNHVNLVFLSNEAMPVVLEDDDRRHGVIWTPQKLSKDFYASLKREIDDGGVAALQHHLLHLDLGDFNEATYPPYTDAKEELIGLARDSTSKFYYALLMGDVGNVKFAPGLSEDAYELYRQWCHRAGEKGIASLTRFVNAMKRRHEVRAVRRRYLVQQSTLGPHWILHFGHPEPPPGCDENAWYGEHVSAFKAAVSDYKGERT